VSHPIAIGFTLSVPGTLVCSSRYSTNDDKDYRTMIRLKRTQRQTNKDVKEDLKKILLHHSKNINPY